MKKLLSKRGFSLAEMLVVVLIISVVAAAAVPLAHKKFRVKKDKGVHGRYECYRDATGQLQEILYNNGIKVRDTFNDGITITKCGFVADQKAAYYIVQVIGAGGGGAYAGDITPRVQHWQNTDAVSIPTNGTVTLPPNAPSWLETVFNNNAPNVTVTATGGGGQGGAGFCNVVNLPDGPCSGELNNNVSGCGWTLDPAGGTTGGNGGGGDSCNASAPLKIGLTITGVAGTEGGGAGSVAFSDGSPGCTAVGGGGGGNASAYANGAPGSPNHSATAGGNGATGCTVPTTGKPPYPMDNKAGGPGSPGSVSANPPTVPYKYTYDTKSLSYGQGGGAGEFKNMFFTKVASNVDVYVGKGGRGGTSTSNYNNEGIGRGERGEATYIGTLLRAEGGVGASGGETGNGQNTNGLTSIDLYKIINDSSYRLAFEPYGVTFVSNVLSRLGEPGEPGAFVGLTEASLPDDANLASLDEDEFKTWGQGGRGGTSSVCVGVDVLGQFNNSINIPSLKIGDATCTTVAEDTAKGIDIAGAGSNGNSGAIVIIW